MNSIQIDENIFYSQVYRKKSHKNIAYKTVEKQKIAFFLEKFFPKCSIKK